MNHPEKVLILGRARIDHLLWHHLRAGYPKAGAVRQTRNTTRQRGGRAVALRQDPVDGRVEQAVGHAVLVAPFPGEVGQVDLK